MTFDPWNYTREAIIKQLTLVELHGKDGSAVEGGCSCIEEKHLFAIEGLIEEAVGFSKTEAEKRFYTWLSDQMRTYRRKIDMEDWTIGSSHACPPCPKCEVGKHG